MSFHLSTKPKDDHPSKIQFIKHDTNTKGNFDLMNVGLILAFATFVYLIMKEFI